MRCSLAVLAVACFAACASAAPAPPPFAPTNMTAVLSARGVSAADLTKLIADGVSVKDKLLDRERACYDAKAKEAGVSPDQCCVPLKGAYMHAIFGNTQVHLDWASIYLFLIVIFTILLESGVEWLNEAVEEQEQYKEMVDKVKEELMILGLVSFSLVIVKEIFHISDYHLIAFEFAHLLIFLVACFYIATALASMKMLKKTKKHWDQTFHMTIHDVKQEKDDSTVEFKIIGLLFLHQYGRELSFDFAKYARKCMSDYIGEALEIGQKAWFTVMGLDIVAALIIYATCDEGGSFGSVEGCMRRNTMADSARRMLAGSDEYPMEPKDKIMRFAQWPVICVLAFGYFLAALQHSRWHVVRNKKKAFVVAVGHRMVSEVKGAPDLNADDDNFLMSFLEALDQICSDELQGVLPKGDELQNTSFGGQKTGYDHPDHHKGALGTSHPKIGLSKGPTHKAMQHHQGENQGDWVLHEEEGHFDAEGFEMTKTVCNTISLLNCYYIGLYALYMSFGALPSGAVLAGNEGGIRNSFDTPVTYLVHVLYIIPFFFVTVVNTKIARDASLLRCIVQLDHHAVSHVEEREEEIKIIQETLRDELGNMRDDMRSKLEAFMTDAEAQTKLDEEFKDSPSAQHGDPVLGKVAVKLFLFLDSAEQGGDNSKQLDKRELLAGLRLVLSKQLSEQQFDGMMRFIDEDKSGEVDLKEFVDFVAMSPHQLKHQQLETARQRALGDVGSSSNIVNPAEVVAP